MTRLPPNHAAWHLRETAIDGRWWHHADKARLLEWVRRKDGGRLDTLEPFKSVGVAYGARVPDRD